MLNIIRKKPKINGDALREREKAAGNPAAQGPGPDPTSGAGTAAKNGRDAPEYAQRLNVLNHQNQPSRFQ